MPFELFRIKDIGMVLLSLYEYTYINIQFVYLTNQLRFTNMNLSSLPDIFLLNLQNDLS